MSDTASHPGRSNVALIISLCINLLLAGVIVMALLRFAVHGPLFGGRVPIPAGPGAGRAQMHQTLSPRLLMHVAPEKSDEIRALVHAHRARIDALRADSMAARRAVMDAFTASRFDKAAFEKALTHMQAADAALETEILKVVSDAALTLTPEERQRAATFRSLGHGFGEGHGRRWRHGRGGRARDLPPPPPPPPPGQEPPP